jgi:hypothetical protein
VKGADPPGCHVGLPDVPSLYGLKPRQQHLPFSHAEERLAKSRNYWICTTRPDGRPHSFPVWGFWLDGLSSSELRAPPVRPAIWRSSPASPFISIPAMT